MNKLSLRIESLSVVRALALAAAVAALPACGASVDGPGTVTLADGGTVTPADGGTTTPTDAASYCPAMCANTAAAQCGEVSDGCVAACRAYIATLPARCAAETRAFFACASTASFECVEDGPEVQGCDAQAAAVGVCVHGSEPPPRGN
ncbi:MAG: hypothetical protein Q8S73_35000 [Deltaproteobacteria bacterium]|nr:hypothetical protein [Myxococcales bacterium]MDP3219361.1 hypothetical protein [Deltaproteobacteria bacterium]